MKGDPILLGHAGQLAAVGCWAPAAPRRCTQGGGRGAPVGGGCLGASHLGREQSSPKQTQNPPRTEDGVRRCLPLVRVRAPLLAPVSSRSRCWHLGRRRGWLAQPQFWAPREHPSGTPDSVGERAGSEPLRGEGALCTPHSPAGRRVRVRVRVKGPLSPRGPPAGLFRPPGLLACF